MDESVRARRRGKLGVLVLVAVCSCSSTDLADVEESIEVHGALRAMFHEGRTDAQVSLSDVLPDSLLCGVGALADLDGEITIVDGWVVLSSPKGVDAVRSRSGWTSDAGAALLVTARVREWRTYTIAAPIRFEELDAAIASRAAAAGFGPDERVPFKLTGDFQDLQCHVIDGKRLEAGGTSHEDHLAASIRKRFKRASATLIGFYSNRDQSIFTHHDTRTHIHAVIKKPLFTGHVDHVTIPAGTQLELPVRGRRP